MENSNYTLMNDREFLEHCLDSHIQWAEWFEANPDEEAKYVATGEWEDSESHRMIAKRYQVIINKLSFLEKAFIGY